MPRKLRIPKSGKVPAATRLRQLSVEARREIAAMENQKGNADIRAFISQRHGINLSSDSQLTRFFAWQRQQEIWDRFNDSIEQDESALRDQFPNVNREQLRELAIKRSYALARAIDDPEITMKVVKGDVDASKDSRDWLLAQRETCELFLKWSEDKRAKEIANSSISNTDKIEQLGQLMFGEDWKK